MALKRRFISDESGASLVLIALMLPVLLGVVGMTIDMGRLYAVRSKAQGAMDAAVLGAVATASTTPVQDEAQRLFDANFSANYMGSALSGFSVVQTGDVYDGRVNVVLTSSFMQLFGIADNTMAIHSQVTNDQGNITMEYALVLDNSAGVNHVQLRNATQNFVTSLFAGAATLPNTYVSVLPYNVAVKVGLLPVTRVGWAQNSTAYTLNGGQYANRNPDIPVDAGYTDVSDAAPAVAATSRFRTPYGVAPGLFANGDGHTAALPTMLFASNTQSEVMTILSSMISTGRQRANVGLMWGWFALSPNWTGRWDAGKPALPMAVGATHRKIMVLVTSSKNDVYLGGTQTCGAGSCAVPNDDTTTAQMCAAIKAQGILLYTIGFGPAVGYNAAQLSACSSGAGYYYTAVSGPQLTTVYQSIIDSVKYTSIRLSQ